MNIAHTNEYYSRTPIHNYLEQVLWTPMLCMFEMNIIGRNVMKFELYYGQMFITLFLSPLLKNLAKSRTGREWSMHHSLVPIFFPDSITGNSRSLFVPISSFHPPLFFINFIYSIPSPQPNTILADPSNICITKNVPLVN